MSTNTKPKIRLDGFVAVLLVCASAGCDASKGSLGAAIKDGLKQAAREDLPSVPEDATPDELAALVQSSQQETNEIERLVSLSGTNQALRIARLKQHIDTGVAAAEKLHASDTASVEQRQSARRWQLALLCQGAKHDRAAYQPRLEQFVSELQQQDGNGSLSGIGAAALVELKFLSAGEPHETTMSALIDYAHSHPDCSAGVVLFQQYGAQLEIAHRSDEANECYRTAADLYGHLPEGAALRARLANLQQAEQARIDRSQAREKKRLDIRRQLGDVDSGYFVIYAREVKPPSGKSFELYAFEYEVLRGCDAAVSYISGLKPNWQWELINRFPDTPAGFAQATKLAEQLTKKRAFIKY